VDADPGGSVSASAEQTADLRGPQSMVWEDFLDVGGERVRAQGREQATMMPTQSLILPKRVGETLNI